MTKKPKDSDNQNNRPNRVRDRLVGLATLLFILAAVAPWILTDKSTLRTSTTPILQPVNGQTIPSDGIDNVGGNTSSVPYIPDTDQSIDDLTPPDIPADAGISTPNIAQSTTETVESKTYLIQLVALKNKQKIEELVALLRLNNYNIRLVPPSPAPDQLIKLQVGPYAKKEQAEQVLIDLNNLTKLKGIIVTN